MRRLPHQSNDKLPLGLFVISFLLLTLPGIAQNLPDTPTPTRLPESLLPKSPTMTAFEHVTGQGNVNLTTGAAQTSIPLFELHSGPLQVPVSLNYSYNGCKVVHPRDLVGIGWALQAGGQVSRQVVGRADEMLSANGHYNSDSIRYYSQVNRRTSVRSQHYFNQILQNNADSAPDIYSYTVADHHGRFILQGSQVRMLPNQAEQMHLIARQGGRVDSAFELLTETGTRYQFEANEITYPNKQSYNISPYTSGWQLTRIISAGNTDTIQFYYTPWRENDAPRTVASTTVTFLRYFKTGQFLSPGGLEDNWNLISADSGISVNYLYVPPVNIPSSGSYISTWALDSIVTRHERVVIRRYGLSSTQQYAIQRLDHIRTLAGQRILVRSFTLGQAGLYGRRSTTINHLLLKSLQESGGREKLPPYRFEYNMQDSLPSSIDMGLDHWGYFNKQPNLASPGSALVPLAKLGNLSANRDPDSTYTSLGTLRQITYPTGGTTSFLYEPNRYEVRQKLVRKYSFTPMTITSDAPYYPHPELVKPAKHVTALQHLRGSSYSFTIRDSVTTVQFNNAAVTTDDTKCNNDPNSGMQPCVNRLLDVWIMAAIPGTDSMRVIDAHKIVSSPEAWTLDLQLGNYILWGLCESTETDINFDMGFPYTVYHPDVIGPGMRVREIQTQTDGAPAIVRRYTYTKPAPLGPCSSGQMLWPVTATGAPVYHCYRYASYSSSNTNGSSTGTYKELQQDSLEVTNSDITRFGDEYKALNFYYTTVTEQLAGAQAGQTIHYNQSHSEQFAEVLPQGMAQYASTGQAWQPWRLLQTSHTSYCQDSSNSQKYYALRLKSYIILTDEVRLAMNHAPVYLTDTMHVRALFVAPASTAASRYDEHGDSLRSLSVTNYRQQRPVRSATLDSYGTWHINRIKYLSDYADSLRGQSTLRANNFNPIVEVQQWQRRTGQTDSALVAGQLTHYIPRWQRPDSAWHLTLTTPVAGPNAETTSGGLYTTWRSDSRYQPVAREGYDSGSGLPVLHQPVHGTPTAYNWGYKQTEPIAQAIGAWPAQLACTSFEAGETGRWSGAVSAMAAPGSTGQMGYTLTGSTLAALQCQGLPAGSYRLSCRVLGSGTALQANGQPLLAIGAARQGWTDYQLTLTIGAAGQVILTTVGNTPVHLDELRLYPAGARITTYTYAPSGDESSVTGPDGRTTYYEYDGLGRLVRTRDEQGRIRSQDQYHYAGQP